MRHWVAVAALAAIIAAGCSDDDGVAADTTTTETPSTSVRPTAETRPPVETSLTSATSASTVGTTSTAATSATPPTDPPVTGTLPPDVFVPPGWEEMRAAYTEFWSVRQQCLRAPGSCERSALERLAEGRALELALTAIDERLTEGLVAKPGAQESYFVFLVVSPSPDATTGVVETCSVNGDVALTEHDPATPADDEVVDDRLVSIRTQSEMRVVDSQWRVTTVVNLDVWEGVNNCPPPE